MSYLVYATSAARFMGRFYERLVARASLSEAVADARRRLFTEPTQDSVVGPIKLLDWPVPSLYQQAPGYVPIPAGDGFTLPAEAPKEEVLRQQAEQVCPEGRFGFVGRDYELLEIDRALRDDQHPWVLLTGVGGTGKTELAFGFARWYAETGGCPGGVFAASFKEKADSAHQLGIVA